MAGSKAWLEQFPAAHHGLIVHWFTEAMREAPEEETKRLCQRLARQLHEVRAKNGPGAKVDQEQILAAMRGDPGGALSLMEWVRERQTRTPEEKAVDKAASEEAGKRAYMAGQPPTQKQLDVLAKLGVEVSPANRLEASDLIEQYKTW